MKKFFLFILSSVFILSSLKAQEYEHEIELGVGVWSSNQIVTAFSDIIVTALPLGIKMENSTDIGEFHLGYKYSMTERFGLGSIFSFNYGYADGAVNSIKTGEFKRYFYTIAVEGDFKYIDNPNFKLYSLLGLGVTYYHQNYKEIGSNGTEKNDELYFNFQITPIGVKFGNRIGGFVEAGFGYRGILSAGLFVRL